MKNYTFEFRGNKELRKEDIDQLLTDFLHSKECDKNKIRLIADLQSIDFKILNMFKPIVNQICNCLYYKQNLAALTLTNYLFEIIIKYTLAIFYERDNNIDNADFEYCCSEGLREFGDTILYRNIESLCKLKVITEDTKNRLLDLKDLFRNPYSHASNNDSINNATTTIYEASLDNPQHISERKVSVTGNPFLLTTARIEFANRYALPYFAEIMNYMRSMDSKLNLIYK